MESKLTQRIDLSEAIDFRCAGCPMLTDEESANSADIPAMCHNAFVPPYSDDHEVGCRKGFLGELFHVNRSALE